MPSLAQQLEEMGLPKDTLILCANCAGGYLQPVWYSWFKERYRCSSCRWVGALAVMDGKLIQVKFK